MIDTSQDEKIKDVKQVILIRPKSTCECDRLERNKNGIPTLY